MLSSSKITNRQILPTRRRYPFPENFSESLVHECPFPNRSAIQEIFWLQLQVDFLVFVRHSCTAKYQPLNLILLCFQSFHLQRALEFRRRHRSPPSRSSAYFGSSQQAFSVMPGNQDPIGSGCLGRAL